MQEKLLSQIQIAFETSFKRTPALLIYGEKDPLNQLGVAMRIKSVLPASELHLVKGEGHFPHEGEPEKMSVLISDWIAGIMANQRGSEFLPSKER